MKKTGFCSFLLVLIAVITVLAVAVSCTAGGTGDKNDETTKEMSDMKDFLSYYNEGDYTDALCLDTWRYRADKDGIGERSGWQNEYKKIGWTECTFPCSFDYTHYNWLSVQINPELNMKDGDRVILRFSGMPYYTKYWVNGVEVGTHTNRFDEFEIDITDAFRNGEDNYICVMCENPSGDNAFGDFAFQQIGLSFSSSPRVQEPVYLIVKPAVYASEVYVNGNDKGELKAKVSVTNTSNEEKTVSVECKIRKDINSAVLNKTVKTVKVPAGVTEVELGFTVENALTWTPEKPNLYDTEICVINPDGGIDTTHNITGFRTLKINDKGFFELNGEVYYIKGTLSSSTCVYSFDNGENVENYYKIITYLKSVGINTIRFLDTVPIPEFIDMCDKVGMMVYSEHPMAWHKYDDAKGLVADSFKACVEAALKTVRSHPSVTMFGFQNETDTPKYQGQTTSKIYDVIKVGPEWARDFAPDLLFLLQSGRFDGNRSLGSGSNPGSYKWDAYLGNESADADDSLIPAHIANSVSRDMGDIHYYPVLPYGDIVKDTYNSLSKYKRGVFVTEAGCGSLSNMMGISLDYAAHGITNGSTVQLTITDYQKFYNDYALDRLYPSYEDVFEASNLNSAKSRSLILTYIRSNPNINGYISTGTMDSEYNGEGLFEQCVKPKDGVAKAVSEGFADLRFTIITDRVVYYKGSDIKLDVRLSDLKHTLSPKGTYTVEAKIVGKLGTVWSKRYDVNGSAESFVIDVMNDKVKANFAEGEYTVSFRLLNGGDAECCTKNITVIDKEKMKSDLKGKTVYLAYDDAELKPLLTDLGVKVVEYTDGANVGKNTVLVGSRALSSSSLDALQKAADNGAHVVFLSHTAINGGASLKLSQTGSVTSYGNWLYHYEDIVFDNSVSSGLEAGMLDSEYYTDVFSNSFFDGFAVPNDVSVASLFSGNLDGKYMTKYGFQLGTYKYGSGYLTLNTLNILPAVGTPVADKIVANLINYEFFNGINETGTAQSYK